MAISRDCSRRGWKNYERPSLSSHQALTPIPRLTLTASNGVAVALHSFLRCGRVPSDAPPTLNTSTHAASGLLPVNPPISCVNDDQLGHGGVTYFTGTEALAVVLAVFEVDRLRGCVVHRRTPVGTPPA